MTDKCILICCIFLGACDHFIPSHRYPIFSEGDLARQDGTRKQSKSTIFFLLTFELSYPNFWYSNRLPYVCLIWGWHLVSMYIYMFLFATHFDVAFLFTLIWQNHLLLLGLNLHEIYMLIYILIIIITFTFTFALR